MERRIDEDPREVRYFVARYRERPAWELLRVGEPGTCATVIASGTSCGAVLAAGQLLVGDEE